MEKKIVIIGAGVAGLSAGIYARLNGYAAEIVEMHTLPGGLCTAWQRQGYTFDGCIHWLMGSGPGEGFHQYWLETGALPGQGALEHEEFIRIGHADGRELIVYTDTDRLEAHLLELAPEDEKAIREMCGVIRKFSGMRFGTEKPRELMGLFDNLKMLRAMGPWLRLFGKYHKLPLSEYWKRFKSPFLRETLGKLFPMDRFPAVAFFFTLAALNNKSAGWAMGGSLEFARRMEKRFTELGGRMRYGARVEKILVEGKRAAGVRLADGTTVEADTVLSAADGETTLFKMLEGRFLDRKTAKSYRSEPLAGSALQLSFGVRMDFSGTPHSRNIHLGRRVRFAGEETGMLFVRHYCFDPSMAPAGCSVVVCNLNGDYKWWSRLTEEEYRTAKAEVLEQVLAILEEQFPGFRAAVEVSDVATPRTFARYTGNREGSIMGWATAVGSLTRRRRRTLKGLADFCMAGQWVEAGGGLPPAVLSGREVVQLLCHRDGKEFRARKPGEA